MLGVCYYPEHWPEALWAEDARRMREFGIAWVRIGEFAWSRIEPARDDWRFDWLDRAVDTLAGAGLQIVMCTPTATPPKWLVDERPAILPFDAAEQPRRFGSRRHYCFSSPAFAAEAARISEVVARRYGSHPAVHAWQLDNEYGCHDTVLSYSPAAKARFRAWLEARFGSIAALNEAWGTVFWSQDYRHFGEIDPPNLTVAEANPAHRLDWRRFASDEVVRFNAEQAAIVRAHSPGRRVTHNFMGFFSDFAHQPVAADLDFASWDSYPLGFTDQRMPWLTPEERRRYARTGHPDVAAFHHDLYRGISPDGSFWVMEQQPGPVNWAPHNPAPAKGMVRLWTLEAMAHGAEVVSYFRWRQAPMAQEQCHAGLNRPDGALDQGGEEAAVAAREIAALGLAAQPTRQAPVALVFDEAAHWALSIQPQGAGFDYWALVFAFYTALRRLGLDVDIKRPGQPLDGYRLVVAPSLPILEEPALAALEATGARLVIGPRTGSRDRHHRIPDGLAPGPLQRLLPLQVTRVESLPAVLEDRLTWRNHAFPVVVWRERIESRLLPEARFADGEGAVFRLGPASYLGFWPSTEFLLAYLAAECDATGLSTTDLGPHLRTRRRGALTFTFNRGPDAVRLGDGATLAPAGVAWRHD